MHKKPTDNKPKKSTSKDARRIEELTADLQRLQADFINFKQRSEKDRIEAIALGREAAVAELLPVFDNLERAFAHTPKELADNTWVKGINGLEKQLVNVLSELGLEKVKTIGEVFDPHSMEAVSVEEGDGKQEIVTDELQSGYLLNGKLLRAAMVKVKG